MNEDTAKQPSLPVPTSKPFVKWIDGFPLPGMLSEDTYRSALNYKPRSDDVFVATYPKCGTTWVQHILVLIYRQGVPLQSMMEFFAATPYIEFLGAETAANMPRPGAIKTHLPYHLVPKSDAAKYIYISRNPKDCCVSYFHHMTDTNVHLFNGTFDDFYEAFMSAEVDYGDYFDHLLGWYAHRNDPNVLFLTYEQLKENPEGTVLKIASFIDDKLYAEPLRNDPEILKKVMNFSSFDHMKEVVNKGIDEMFTAPKEVFQNSDIIPQVLKDLLSKLPMPPPGAPPPKKSTFIRKGIIGDWRNYFSEEQSKKLDEKFVERTKGTDIPDLFQKYM